MYYPIIDKLKAVMMDLTSVKEKEPLVIEGTVTSETGGIWVGNWSDITHAFEINKPVYFTITFDDNKYLTPVVSIGSVSAGSCVFYLNQMVYGNMLKNNVFYITEVQ